MTMEEKWIDRIKKRVDEHVEPAPPVGWERLQAGLQAVASARSARLARMHRRIWAVAAVLLAAVSGISLWLLHQADGRQQETDVMYPWTAEFPLAHLEQPVEVEEQSLSLPNKAKLMQKGKNFVLVSQHVVVEEDEGQDTVNHTPTVSKQPEERKVTRKTSERKTQLPVVEKHSPASTRKWSIGLAVGNAGGWSNLLTASGGNDYPMMSGTTSNVQNMAGMSAGVLTIPEGQQVVFKDGIPYILGRSKVVSKAEHKQPISFGLSIRKELARGFAVETGLVYTFLASDVWFEGSSDKVSQKLHYLGIPLKGSWSFWEKQKLTCYLSAGGMVEKCLYGTLEDESQTVRPLQFSLMAAVGIQYNLNRRVGLYIEPGLSYYFDDGSEVQTIRKETPCNFMLQGGIRLRY